MDSPLRRSISETESIKLDYKQNSISFEFAAIDFTSPEKNKYAYKMDGLDKDWIFCGNNRLANYINLDPGYYVFRIKGCNNDGLWNEQGASVQIIISPPWWATGWAYDIYAVLSLATVAFTWRVQLRRIHLQNDLKMRTFESEKLKEVDSLKSSFFANISHEFRTPITLILGPLEKILPRIAQTDIKQDLTLMQRNARRLLRLINSKRFLIASTRRMPRPRENTKESGIGLALTKELVELFQGDISVASEPGVGTTFIIRLPLGRAHLKDDDIVESISAIERPVLQEPSSEIQTLGDETMLPMPPDSSEPK
ncbi:hypothetical protein EH222_05430 [candidate division KSB1 bacterium]|nr:MAG: hypothetical protein EH222_05430 [candidate division KSB1 bacterium]